MPNPIDLNKDILKIDNAITELNEVVKILKTGLSDALQQVTKDLSDLDKMTVKTSDDLKKQVSGIEQTEKNLKDLSQSTNQLTEYEKQLLKIKQEKEKLNAKIKASNTEEAKQLELLRLQSKKLTDETVKLRIEAQKQTAQQKQAIKVEIAEKNSINALQATTNQLIAKRKALNLSTEAGRKEFEELTKTINTNNKQLKDYDSQIGVSNRNVGNYKSALDGLKPSFIGLTGAITALLAIGSQLIDQINETNRVSQKLTQTTGSTGDVLNDLTIKTQTIAKTFDVDFNEVIRAANVLSKEMGISFDNALNQIDEGFQKGSNTTGEYLEILREYPAQFKAAGIEADQMQAIINQSIKEGIFSDKGADAIKEGLLRLREMTPATMDALKAIGFTSKEIQQGIQDGTLASFEGMQKIAARLKEFEDNSPQVGQALADIFGGPGEDAGIRYIRMLADVESNLDNVEIQATDLTIAQRQLTEEWTKFIVGVSTGESIFGQIFANLTDFVGDLLHSLNQLGEGGKATMRSISEAIIRLIAGPLNGLNTAIKALTGEDLLGDFTDWINNITGLTDSAADKIGSAFTGANEAIKISNEETTINFEEQLARRTNALQTTTAKEKKIKDDQIKIDDLNFEKEIDRAIKEEQADAKKQENIFNKFQDRIAKEEALKNKQIEDDRARALQQIEIFSNLTEQVGQIVGDSLFDAEQGFKGFGKKILILALDLLEKQIQISIAAATAQSLASAESVATFGIAGAAKAALLAGLIKAAFQVAKNMVSRFEDGGRVGGNNGVDGLWSGKSHAQGGIKGQVKSTGQLVEFEGDEYIINKKVATDKKQYSFTGTPLQIASSLNEAIKYQDGGRIPTASTPIQTTTMQTNSGLDYNKLAELIVNMMQKQIQFTKFVVPVSDINNINMDSMQVARGSNI